MWRLLARVSASKQTAIVLTTHNMIECEAVCTRVGIMKLGRLVCLGDSQHLRSTHGTGYMLEVSLSSIERIGDAKRFVSSNFVGAILIDEHLTMINFEIPKESIVRLSAAFRILEENKEQLGVVSYALSQSTLEQVFLKKIRNDDSAAEAKKVDSVEHTQRHPFVLDYVLGYLSWLIAILIPGFHHWHLGNRWRAVFFFFTWNQVFAGWVMDLFELHILVQQSVQQHGHATGFCCTCCAQRKNISHSVPVEVFENV